ncbi:MAG: glycosyltransferase [Acidimicrobiales bacterium]
MNRRVRPDADATVSAVIPFFNHGMVVDEALEAIRRQSRPVDEIVVVDDGSTDPYSLSVLARLEADGVAVVHQHNQGPGSARNLGAEQCAGDAILFLDSDDTVSEHHVERALGALAGAPAEVGFVYPDMQFMGNEHHLVVMPPYNLYLLLHRNFCCMGGLIDRSVFDAGFRFRSDRLVGHEDWDFFVNLGVSGIYGRPFHGAPLGYRRWGFSRSDAVNESQTGLAEVREHHPDLSDSARMIAIKREWAPALSVVVRNSDVPVVAHQSCDDFEIVVYEGEEAPPARGRWILMLAEDGIGALGDPWFVERVIRLASGLAHPAPLYLYRPEGTAATTAGWRRMARPAAPRAPFGIVAGGYLYSDWRGMVGGGTVDRAHFCAQLDASVGTELGPAVCWEHAGVPDAADLPLLTFRPSRPPPDRPSDPMEASGNEVERAFRHLEAPPLFMPAHSAPRLPEAPGSTRDGLEAIIEQAWLDWMPSRSLQLNLVVSVLGQSTLETCPHPDPGSVDATPTDPATVPIGWIWAQPFPGTACLLSHRDPSTLAISYRVSLDGAAAPGEAVLGYVPTEFLPGRVALLSSLAKALGAVRGLQRVTPPPLAPPSFEVFVEPAAVRPAPRGVVTTEAVPPPSHRWPLVEAAFRNWSRSPRSWPGRARRAIG